MRKAQLAVLSIWCALGIVACQDKTDLAAPLLAPSSVIIPRPDPNAYIDIVAGGDFSCVRRNSAAVFCWGGIGGLRPSVVMNSLISPPDTMRVTSMDAGASHICIVTTTSDGFCWGGGDYGQLGIGGGQYTTGSSQPLPVAGGLKFSSIGAGSNLSCGTATTGVFCWGQNAAFTDNHQDNLAGPFMISSYTGFRSLTQSVGRAHACTMEIVGSSRAVDCWGVDSVGQLGIDPAIFPNHAPFTVRAGFGTSVSRVVADYDETCAEQTSGALQCVGSNANGQLGNGSTGGFSFTPQTVGTFHGVTIGVRHVCALDSSNQAWCWGNGSWGELGDSTTNNSSLPVRVKGGHAFRAIAAGVHHTCAIGTDNALYCWGANYVGQMGQNSTQPSMAWTTPGRVYDPR